MPSWQSLGYQGCYQTAFAVTPCHKRWMASVPSPWNLNLVRRLVIDQEAFQLRGNFWAILFHMSGKVNAIEACRVHRRASVWARQACTFIFHPSAPSQSGCFLLNRKFRHSTRPTSKAKLDIWLAKCHRSGAFELGWLLQPHKSWMYKF